MKLIDLLKARKVLDDHSAESIPTTLAYKIVKFIKATDVEANFYQEQIKILIDKYATKDENGNINVLPENAEEWNVAITELQNTLIDTPAIRFNLIELEPLMFSVADMFALNELIIDEQNNAI